MKPSIQQLFDQLAARLAALETNLSKAKTELRNLATVADSALSGTINSAIASLSGTVDAEFIFMSGTIASLSGTINSGFVSLSGTINSKFASGLRLLNIQDFFVSGIYAPTTGTIAVKLTIVGGGPAGGPATTTAGAAGGGGSSAEWAVIWYNPMATIVGQAVTVAGPTAGGGTAGGSGIMIDGVTFACIGGNVGATSTAVASYGEADAPALGTSGSVAFDLYRGSNPSVAAMASSTTTISAYTAGIGGGTPFGKGGRGSGGDAVGGSAGGFGSGGGGGRRGGATNRLGGSGSQGAVFVEEYGR